jgi:hypothetical protein
MRKDGGVHCTKNWIYVFLEKELRGLSPNSCVWLIYNNKIYFDNRRRGANILFVCSDRNDQRVARTIGKLERLESHNRKTRITGNPEGLDWLLRHFIGGTKHPKLMAMRNELNTQREL